MNGKNPKEDLFAEIDNVLSELDGVTVEGGTDPSAEDDNCVGGACKL